MKVAAGFIEKYKELQESKYVEFFSKGMNKLLSNYQLIEGILGKVDDLLDDIEETREEIRTIETVTGNSFINSPVYPGQNITGINAAKVVPVEARIG